MKIGSFEIGKNKTFIIAELSANHGNSIKIVKETIKAAKRAGADAIKLQTYTADSLTLNSKRDEFVIKGTIWDGTNLYELYKEASLPYKWYDEIFSYATKLNIICFSSPFDEKGVDVLEKYNVPAYKIASFEINHIPLIKYAASKGKPMIISTGIATLSDIENAIKACNSVGNYDVCLLKCTSSYPAKINDANLSQIIYLKNKFKLEVGLSDHTIGSLAPVIAVSKGASIVEKHFILNKDVGGPDASFSMEEKDFKKMVKEIRMCENSLGEYDFELTAVNKSKRYFSRSIYISKNVKKGELVTVENIKVIRPNLGMHPENFDDIIGKKFKYDIEFATPLKKSMIE